MDPFIGELRLFPYNFAPRGWASCNGQLLPIAQYTALFSLLGTNYGGNGTTTFALPDLRGRAPIGVGQQVAVWCPAGLHRERILLRRADRSDHEQRHDQAKCRRAAT